MDGSTISAAYPCACGGSVCLPGQVCDSGSCQAYSAVAPGAFDGPTEKNKAASGANLAFAIGAVLLTCMGCGVFCKAAKSERARKAAELVRQQQEEAKKKMKGDWLEGTLSPFSTSPGTTGYSRFGSDAASSLASSPERRRRRRHFLEQGQEQEGEELTESAARRLGISGPLPEVRERSRAAWGGGPGGADFTDEGAESVVRGIGLSWVLRQFPSVACKLMELPQTKQLGDQRFHELYPRVAVGETGIGFGKRCPRDGQPNCSIVDAVHADGGSAAATIYLSWSWENTVEQATSALLQWSADVDGSGPAAQGRHTASTEHFIWWCFFSVNHYRPPRPLDADVLAYSLAMQLRSIGSMLVVIDKPTGPLCLERLWCVFENVVASELALPTRFAVAESGRREVEELAESGLEAIEECLAFNVGNACASNDEEEALLTTLVERIGPIDLGRRVSEAMRSHYMEVVIETERRKVEQVDQQQVEESKMRGISLAWILHRFPILAGQKMGLDDMSQLSSKNFHELAPILAKGETGFGFGKLCPRDGVENCSIVDAVHAGGHSARATTYLSWVWGYTVEEVTSALCRWTSSGNQPQAANPFLWWCFFTNNQYRLPSEADVIATASVRLKQIGSMLIVIEKPEAPAYPTRLWCLFEAHVAGLEGVSIEVAIAESGWESLMADRDLGALRRRLAVDVQSAVATVPSEEVRLRKVIETSFTPEVLNQEVLLLLRNLWNRLCGSAIQDQIAPIGLAVESWAEMHDRLSPRSCSGGDAAERAPEQLHLEIAAWEPAEAPQAEPLALHGRAAPFSHTAPSWQPNVRPMDGTGDVRPLRPSLLEALQPGQAQKDHLRLASTGGSLRPAALCEEESDGDVSPFNSAGRVLPVVPSVPATPSEAGASDESRSPQKPGDRPPASACSTTDMSHYRPEEGDIERRRGTEAQESAEDIIGQGAQYHRAEHRVVV